MADVFGTVQRITSRPQGNGKAYSVYMDDGEWYGHGFQQPTFQEGQQISFMIAWNGQYKNIDVGSVQIQGGAPQQQQQQQPPQQQGGRKPAYNKRGGSDKDKYWEQKAKDDKARQATIEHQSSRNAAINLIDIAMRESAIKLPAKAAEKFDALLLLVDEVTDKFNRDLHPDKNPDPAEYQPPHQEGYQE